MKIRLITFTAALLGLQYQPLHAEEVTSVAAETSPTESGLQEITRGESTSPVSHLQFDRSLSLSQIASDTSASSGELSTTPGNPTATQTNTNTKSKRMRLRMSKHIENTDGLEERLLVQQHAINEPIPQGSTVIEGDKLEVQLDRTFTATGNASIKKDEQAIYGDTLKYDIENDQLNAIGNVRVESADTSVTGPTLKMNLGESIGEMLDAAFYMKNSNMLIQMRKSNTNSTLTQYNDIPQPFSTNASGVTSNLTTESDIPRLSSKARSSRGEAKAIFFEGQDKKRLLDAKYTTCAADSDDWYLKSGSLELNDYSNIAKARNAYVEFKGVPIVYTPWINFSTLNQRKSGLLAPTWGTTTKSGFELLTPYYWNISPNMDATLATRILSKRGVQYNGEFRYLGENYSGTDNLEYLPGDDVTNENRYYAKLTHKQTFNNGFAYGYNYEKVSDDNYFSELSSRIITTSRVNLAQQANVSYSGRYGSLNALVQKYQTLDQLSYPYERLPQITYNFNRDWGVSNFNLSSEFVAFDRERNTYLAALASGATSSTLVNTNVTGNRVMAYPSISIPLDQPYGYIKPKLGLRYASYQLDNPSFTFNGVTQNYNSTDFTVPIFSVDSGLFFDRKTQIVKNSYTQTLEPRMFYVYIPYRDQSLFPVFDSGEADLNLGTLFLENQFSGNDRINNANQLSLAVTSRMIDSNTGEQRLAATLGQRFYFTDQKVGLPTSVFRTSNSSDIVAAVTAHLTNNWNIDSAWQYNTSTSDTVKANFGGRYNPEPGKVLNLSYRYTQEKLEQFNISGQWPLGRGWYGMGRWNYSVRESRPIEGLAGLEYDAGCWLARGVLQRLPTATTNANYAIFFQLELSGIASIGSSPMSVLNRSIPGYKSSGMLPDSYREQNYE